MRQFEIHGPGRKALLFFALVFLLSVPFWLYGTFIGGELVPGLPVSGLMAVCPALAALSLETTDRGWSGAKQLLWAPLDRGREFISIWYVIAVLLLPLVGFATFFIANATGIAHTASLPMQPWVAVLLTAAFLVAAAFEELGWSAYATNLFLTTLTAVQTGVVIGVVWAVWHWVPLLQAGRSASWIGWWTLGTIAFRVLIVWVYANTNRSTFAALVMHASLNVTSFVLPAFLPVVYDPLVTGILLTLLAFTVIVCGRESFR